MLEMEGDAQALNELLALLGKESGLTLSLGADNRVTAARTGDVPRSPRLAEALQRMCTADPETARVTTAGRAVHFGFFGKQQKLNVGTVLAIEKGAPGIGVVVAIHEIWENFKAWRSDGQLGKYGPAHASAVAVEGQVGQELTGRPSVRVAAADFGTNTAPAYVLDLNNRFVQLDARPEPEVAQHGLFVASVRDRTPVGRIDLDVATADRLDAKVIADAKALLKENRRATARLTALHTADESAENSGERAEAVRNALVVALGVDKYDGDTGITLRRLESSGAGADLGAYRVWINPDRVQHTSLGVRIDVEQPA